MREFLIKDCQELFDKVSSDEVGALRNSTVFISGASGFLGSWITEVVLFLNDNFNFNTRLVLHSRDVSKLPRRNDVKILEGDIRNLLEIPSDVQWVIHAASSPDARVHTSDPINTLDILSNGTNAVLSASSRLPNLKKFLYVSSALIYKPSVELNSVSDVYTEGKRYSESLVTAYRSLYKLPTTVIRPFTFLGPKQLIDKPWAMNNFIRDALNGGPIRIFGNVESLRTYMYGSDFAFWTLKILTSGEIGKSYNVGASQSFSILDIAKKVVSLSPQNIQIELCPFGNQVRSDLIPDVSLAESTLSLRTTVDIDAAIKKTISWYKN